MQAAAEDAVAFSFAEIGGCGKVRDGDLFGKMFVHIDHHRLYLIPGAAGRSGRLLKYRRDVRKQLKPYFREKIPQPEFISESSLIQKKCLPDQTEDVRLVRVIGIQRDQFKLCGGGDGGDIFLFDQTVV